MSFNYKRISTTFGWDMKLQLKYGFFHVTSVVTVVWIAMLFNVDPYLLYNLFPFFVLSNMTVTSYYFMCAMILFEKGERTIHGLTVTPLRFWEYLFSKLLALSSIAVFESLIIILVIFRDFEIQVGWIIVGLLFLSFFNSIVGFISIAKHQNINEFIIPSIGWLSLLSIPTMWFLDFGRDLFFLYFLIPTSGPFMIVARGFGVTNTLELFFASVVTLIQLPLYFKIAKRYFSKYIIQEVH